MIVAFPGSNVKIKIGTIQTIWRYRFSQGPSAQGLIIRKATYQEWIEDGKQRWTEEQLNNVTGDPYYKLMNFYEVQID